MNRQKWKLKPHLIMSFCPTRLNSTSFPEIVFLKDNTIFYDNIQFHYILHVLFPTTCCSYESVKLLDSHPPQHLSTEIHNEIISVLK